ncbi:unnamed protein product [Ceratitis capitata]|uniref:(Mediterranean fruit fly) hypothetical protein n=4 Tax=Ceratitis capitata TaxID=7213 RepID=A0A811U486_CERCA|nr:unnamed protein product [Ceratitis capitata]
MPLRINHPVKTQQRNNEYLPPYTTESNADKAINYSANTIRPPSYQANKIQQQMPQFNKNKITNTEEQQQKQQQQQEQQQHQQSNKNLYTSYAAPASGSAPFLYSQPQAANRVPLPTLFPKSLVDQLSPTAQQQQMQMQMLYHHQQQQQQQQQHQPQSQYFDQTQQITADLPLTNAPLLMVEEPTSSLLTPSQNLTLEAARILASTLLEANGEAPLETPGLAPLSNPNGLALPNQLNSTDVLILKSQKNAYIIPAQLAKDARNPSATRALYQMRDQLDKAYTINQFVFIIKPERINFLNKLV